jgi:hypothetical protein
VPPIYWRGRASRHSNGETELTSVCTSLNVCSVLLEDDLCLKQRRAQNLANWEELDVSGDKAFIVCGWRHRSRAGRGHWPVADDYAGAIYRISYSK